MRVIGGEFRSRRLESVPGLRTRPTPDRLREALFNVLAPQIEGVVFVDAYAGTGAVGIEALSRGARRAVFLERSRRAAFTIRQNLASLGALDRAEVAIGRAAALLRRYPGDIVFIDPPYDEEREYEMAMAALQDAARSLVIVQHASRFEMPEQMGRLIRVRLLRQGDNSLSFFEERAVHGTAGQTIGAVLYPDGR